MPRLSPEERNRAIGMLNAGISIGRIAAIFNVSRQTVCGLRQRFNRTGRVDDLPRSGRPRVTSAVDDRYIRLSSLRSRFTPATTLRNEFYRHSGNNISVYTVRRRLRQAGLRARRPLIAVPLRDEHRQARHLWANQHLNWNRAQWNSVLFSDESRFNVDFADRRQRVYRRRNERWSRCCISEHDRFGGGSVCVWGGVTWNGRTDLIRIDGNLTARRYIDEILRPVVTPFINQHPGYLFQQDNARPHTAYITRAYFNANNINLLQWPSRSPDLAPIEHVWDYLGRHARERHDVSTRDRMWQALRQEWQAMPQQEIQRVIGSMRRRCIACVRSNGGHTRY